MRELSMKYHIAAGLVVAAAVTFSATAVGAVNKPVQLPQTASMVEKAKCIGFRVNYSSFAQCMRANPGMNKHCNRICQH
jgi:cytochrome bd-type quinol oxidase subunit 1